MHNDVATERKFLLHICGDGPIAEGPEEVANLLSSLRARLTALRLDGPLILDHLVDILANEGADFVASLRWEVSGCPLERNERGSLSRRRCFGRIVRLPNRDHHEA